MDKCAKHDDTMDRIFKSLNKGEVERAQIITKMDNIIEFKDKIDKIMFGNGQEGLISKVRRVAAQAKLQWGLIGLILLSIVGYSIRLLWK